MKVLYDRKSSLTWPDGTTMTPEELEASPIYNVLFKFDHVLENDEDGVTYSYSRLAYLKDSYGVVEDDPEKALALVEQAMAEAAKEAEASQITLADIQAQLDALTGAN